MISRRKIHALYELAAMGGSCGILLLIRPLIYMIFARRRDLDAYASVDASAVIFILYAIICFFLSARELNRRGKTFGRNLFIHSSLLWISLYTVLGLVSMIWSVNLQLTGFRAFECMSMMMLMASVVQNLFYRGGCKTVIQWTMLYVTVDIIFSIIRTLSYTADVMALLQSSQMMATTFFYVAFFQSPKKWWNYLIIIMSIFSMSTVAYIGMALGSISTFFGPKKYRGAVILAFLILGGVIAVIGPYKFIKDTVFFDKQSISIHETTGRDKIMEVALEALEEKSGGYGFFSGEPYLLYNRDLGAINGHNSLFSAAIGLGIPGILLMLLFFLTMIKTVFSRYIPPEYRASLIGCFCVSFLQSMGNPGIGSRVFGGWMPTMFATVLICGFYVYGKYYKR
jgi:O-antigen ligase